MGFNIGGYTYNSQMASTEVYKSISQRGLKLNLDASSVDSYSGAGTTWYDLTTNSYNGTLINGPTYSSTNGGYIQCDGSNDVVMLYSTGQWSFGSGNFGIGMWINTSATTGNIFQTYNCCGSYGAGVSATGKFSFGFRDDSCSNNPSAVTPLSYNNSTWYYAFFQRSGTTAQIYINGVSVASNTVAGTGAVSISNGSFQICNASSNTCPVINCNNEGPLAAKIGAVHIYNRALDVTEIAQNYNIQKSRFGL